MDKKRKTGTDGSVMDKLAEIKQKVRSTCPELLSDVEDLESQIVETLADSLKAKKRAYTPEDFSDDDEGDASDPWMVMYQQLREYRTMNGNCQVPMKYPPNPKLGTWLHNQKINYRNLKLNRSGTKLKPDRVAKLDALGMVWGKEFPAPATWDDRFGEFQKYKKAFRSDPPVDAASPSPLGAWVSCQRNEFRNYIKSKGTLLTDEQIELLNEMEFDWKGPRIA